MRIFGTIAILVAATCWAKTAVSQENPFQEAPEENLPQDDSGNKFCLNTDNVNRYKVESDHLIRFMMNDDFDILMRVKRHCAQLYFHKYISYTPVNGLLCEGVDEIKTRSGLPCRIESLEKIEKKRPEETNTAP